jgi:hypothetical protein
MDIEPRAAIEALRSRRVQTLAGAPVSRLIRPLD